MSNSKDVRLPGVNKSELLSEVTRAYMHGTLPSALLYRIELGLTQFLQECNLNSEDHEFTVSFGDEIKKMHKEWRVKEDQAYTDNVYEKAP